MLRLATVCFLGLAAGALAATHTDSATKLRFPDSLGAWTRSEVHRYPEPGLGTAISYHHPHYGTVSIYIYNAKLARIPTGATNGIVEEEFQNLLEGIEASHTREKYQDSKRLTAVKTEIRKDHRIATVLAAVYSYSDPETRPPQHMTYALLTGYRNRFMKLRYTLLADGEQTSERGQTELKEFLAALVAVNEKSAPGFFTKAEPVKKEPITEKMVRAAIADFRKDPRGAMERGGAAKIIQFVNDSPTVLVSIGKKAVPWLGEKTDQERSSLLLTGFVAGNLQSQLNRKVKSDDSLAGVRQEIATYRQLQATDPEFRVDEIEKLIGLEAEGKLVEYLEKK